MCVHQRRENCGNSRRERKRERDRERQRENSLHCNVGFVFERSATFAVGILAQLIEIEARGSVHRAALRHQEIHERDRKEAADRPDEDGYPEVLVISLRNVQRGKQRGSNHWTHKIRAGKVRERVKNGDDGGLVHDGLLMWDNTRQRHTF